ncbi:hypothetical protein Ssi02_71810 [Sinosporangium siamense]|uniref:DUF3566 domain-containing protein n=1 Tax=Sinosporangium siamense TaxID=1367973 RepID=A0A919RQ27_9ACTN|nr:DUF3566 domain-containing protein [Sinosporangium siamense]GII96950.1 hypothetical protein Ssi02_71810 [Sinosporangium siamense]
MSPQARPGGDTATPARRPVSTGSASRDQVTDKKTKSAEDEVVEVVDSPGGGSAKPPKPENPASGDAKGGKTAGGDNDQVENPTMRVRPPASSTDKWSSGSASAPTAAHNRPTSAGPAGAGGGGGTGSAGAPGGAAGPRGAGGPGGRPAPAGRPAPGGGNTGRGPEGGARPAAGSGRPSGGRPAGAPEAPAGRPAAQGAPAGNNRAPARPTTPTGPGGDRAWTAEATSTMDSVSDHPLLTTTTDSKKSGSKSKGGRNPRKAHLVLRRIEPWSAMKFSFVVSLVCFVVLFVAVAVLYIVLSAVGVFDSIVETVNGLTASEGGKASATSTFDIASWFEPVRILGYTALIGAVNVVLITALATLGSVIYNLASDLVGGIEVTFSEAE